MSFTATRLIRAWIRWSSPLYSGASVTDLDNSQTLFLSARFRITGSALRLAAWRTRDIPKRKMTVTRIAVIEFECHLWAKPDMANTQSVRLRRIKTDTGILD